MGIIMWNVVMLGSKDFVIVLIENDNDNKISC